MRNDRVNHDIGGCAALILRGVDRRAQQWDGDRADAPLLGHFKRQSQGAGKKLTSGGFTEHSRKHKMEDEFDAARLQAARAGDEDRAGAMRGERHRLALDLGSTGKPDRAGKPGVHHAPAIGGIDDRFHWLIDDFTGGGADCNPAEIALVALGLNHIVSHTVPPNRSLPPLSGRNSRWWACRSSTIE